MKMAASGHGQYQQMMPQHREGQQPQPQQQQGQPFQGVQGPVSAGLPPGQQSIVSQPQQQVPPPLGPVTSHPQMMSPVKEPNAISLCKRGQEFVQEVVQKVAEVFKQMQTKQMLLPNGVNCSNQMYQDRKAKLDEHLQMLAVGFKKLRVFYDKVIEMSAEFEDFSEELLIPVVGEPFENTTTSSSEQYYRYVSEENRDVVEQLHAKNEQLKEIIDQMRTIIWEINTMIVMRKT